MEKEQRAALAAAECFLQNDRFDEVAKVLAAIDESRLSAKDSAQFLVIRAEMNLYTGRCVAVDLDAAIELCRHTAKTPLFARAKFLRGWLFSTSGKYLEAKEELLEAYANFKRCEDSRGCARSLNRMAFVNTQLGSYVQAIENIETCAAVYSDLGDTESETLVSMNLGSLRLMMGSLREASEAFLKVDALINKTGNKNKLLFYLMSSLPHALRGDIATARATIAKAQPFLDKFLREKAIYFENLGRICLLDEDYQGAEKALKEGLAISMEIAPESALVSQITRLVGDLYLATDKRQLAERYATEALAVAEKIGEKVEIAACWRLYGQLAVCRLLFSDAQRWYRQALDLFHQIGTRYELAVTRYFAGSHAFHDPGERVALLHLARTYFDSESVTPYIKRVDEALKTLVPLRRRPLKKRGETPRVVAESTQMKKLLALAQHVAQSEMTVLLTGATGTGKDLVARYVHYHSGRSGEFVSLNAAAIPDHLIEAELFGHVEGAFTGTVGDRAGLCRRAHKGTLYLNEIGDASLEFQAKLLEVLETHRVRRVGADTDDAVAFRVIAATNQDLVESIKRGRFRMDLYHRLNEVPLHLPSLSERREDIGPLVRHFLSFTGFHEAEGEGPDLLSQLCELLGAGSWPGNVRELEYCVDRLWVTGRGSLSEMLSLASSQRQRTQREELLSVLEQTGGNKSEAARRLGVSEGTIRHRLRKLEGGDGG